jgi:ABC-2 type transport system permease protein
VLAISRALLLAFIRDRTAIFFTIAFPLMFLVLFGGLLTSSGSSRADVLEVGPVAVVDQLSPDARAQFDKSVKLTRVDDVAAAKEKVRKGDAAAAVVQQGNQLLFYYSQADPVRAATVGGIFSGLTQASGGTPTVALEPEQVEDKSLKTIQYFTPGLLGWSLATAGTAGAALTLVGWRKSQLMRRLQLAPVSPVTVVTARVLVSLLLGLVQMAIFLGVAMLPFFGLHLTGFWWMAIPLVVAGVFAFLSVGLAVAAVARTEDAAQGLVQVIVLPMAFLSGSFFPLDNAPQWLRSISRVLPLRYLVDALSDVLVRGAGPLSVLPTIGGLLVFATVLTFVASRFFRWDET